MQLINHELNNQVIIQNQLSFAYLAPLSDQPETASVEKEEEILPLERLKNELIDPYDEELKNSCILKSA